MGQVIEKNGYALFWGAWPSNWEYSPFILNDIKYNCVEQYMMAEKARLFGDQNTLDMIMNTSDPATQKRYGRAVRGFIKTEWDKICYSIVLRATIEKYLQNPELLKLLLASGELEFVEASPNDTIWGIGMNAKDPNATNPAKWRGTNLLGKAITEARQIIKLRFIK